MTYGDVLRNADAERKKVLCSIVTGAKAEIAEAEKKIEKAQKEIDFLELAPLVPED